MHHITIDALKPMRPKDLIHVIEARDKVAVVARLREPPQPTDGEKRVFEFGHIVSELAGMSLGHDV